MTGDEKSRQLVVVWLGGLALGAISAILGAVGGYRHGSQETHDQMSVPLQALADQNRDLKLAIKATEPAERELAAEREECDKMFDWYERCLDGRGCTQAAEGEPPLVLRRDHLMPQLPNNRLPGEKTRIPYP